METNTCLLALIIGYILFKEREIILHGMRVINDYIVATTIGDLICTPIELIAVLVLLFAEAWEQMLFNPLLSNIAYSLWQIQKASKSPIVLYILACNGFKEEPKP